MKNLLGTGNSLVWNSDGADIYYQGESKKELPIECTVSYELNGEKISAKDLAGKSGNVKVCIEYTNKDEHIVNINGKSTKLYTPFVAVCGTIIDNKTNRSIEVTNGKVIDDGTKTIVMGISIPGMQESLGVSKSEFEVPSKIEITMDSTDFELGNIVTYVTPKIFEESDLEIFDRLDEVYSKVNTLSSSANQLEEGANTLKSGTSTYYEKSKEFNSAMKQVFSGASNASKSYSKLDSGISSLSKSSSTLKSGAKSLSDGISTVSSSLKALSTGTNNLQAGTQKLQEGQKKASAGLDTIVKSVSTSTSEDSKKKLEAQITQLTAIMKENTESINELTEISKDLQVKLQTATPDEAKSISKQLTANKSAITALTKDNYSLQATIDTLKSSSKSMADLGNGLSSLQSGMSEISAGIDGLLDGEKTLKTGIDTLSSVTDEKILTGAEALYGGTVELEKGTQTLNAGSSEMKKGLNTLSSGALGLNEASNQLTAGANTISEGANTLARGVSKFNKEGVQTLCNYINRDVKDISSRLESLQDLANKYNNFTMLSDGNQGKLKFIMIMDGIKKDSEMKEEVILSDNKENEKVEENNN